jgi:chemotaxis protein methyltransferase CheR
MNDRQFKQLLDWFGLSWEGYFKVRKGVKKRIRRHMQEIGCLEVEQYLEALAANPQITEECRLLLTVSISRFFRDAELWRLLEYNILPGLIRPKEHDAIKVWSAGCARGEEIYSFKIVWDRLSKRFDSMPELQAWATDMNPEYIAAARRGVYSVSSLKEFPEGIAGEYLDALEQKPLYALRDFVKAGIVWERLDLLHDQPPAEGLHLVFLRNNLLTYFDHTLIQPALSRVIDRLATYGYLIIGAKEKLPASAVRLRACPLHSSLFVKVEGTDS